MIKQKLFYVFTIFCFIFMVGIGGIFGSVWSFVSVFGTISIFTTLYVYSAGFFTLRKSTVYNNLLLTKGGKSAIYTSLFLFILFINVIVFSFFMSIYIIIENYAGTFFPREFIYDNNLPLYVNWLDVWWSVIIYYLFMSTVMTFLLLHIIQIFTKTQKVFWIFGLSYLLYFLFFGRVNRNMIKWDVDLADGSISLAEGSEWFFSNISFWLGQLSPHFWLNQFAFFSIFAGSYSLEAGIYAANNFNYANPWKSGDKYWNAGIYLPLVVLGILIIVIVIMHKWKELYSYYCKTKDNLLSYVKVFSPLK